MPRNQPFSDPASPGSLQVWNRTELFFSLKQLLADVWASTPLLPVAMLLSMALLLSNMIPGPNPFLSWICGGLGFCFLGLFFKKHLGEKKRNLILLLAGTFLSLVFFRLNIDFPDPLSISQWSNQIREELMIRGVVLEKPDRSKGSSIPSWSREPRVAVLVEIQFVNWQGQGRNSTGLLLVRCPGTPDDFPAGAKVRAQGKFRPLPQPMNPGEIQPLQFWRRKGVNGTLDCRTIPLVENKSDISWIPEGFSIQGFLAPFKKWATDRLGQLLEGEDTGLAEALLLGNTRAVDYSEWDKFRKTGTIHALAISGQHLLIAGAIIRCLLSLFRVPTKTNLILSTSFVILYALLTGAQPSAVRASIMTVAFGTAWLLGRKTPVVNILCLAWILIGIIQPNDLTSPGCQLSFMAVFLLDGWQRWKVRQREKARNEGAPGAVLDRLEEQLRPPWKRALFNLGNSILELYKVNAWVCLGLCPLLWFHTSLISLSSLILGPIIALCCTAALGCGMLAVLIPIPFLDRLLASIGNRFLQWTKIIADIGEELPLSWFYRPPPPLWLVAVWLILFAIFLLPRRTWVSKKIIGALCAGLLLMMVWWPFRLPPTRLLVQALSIGHGTAVLIEEPSGRVVLYDGGSMAGGEPAGRIISQVLWNKGIVRLDEIILSHADTDHFNAIGTLLERFTVEIVSVGPSFRKRDDKEAFEFTKSLVKARVGVKVISRDCIAKSGEVIYSVLFPDPGLENPPNQNVASIVLAIEYYGKVILLTGDLEPPATQRLLSQKNLPRNILAMMAPHHGSPAANPDYLWRYFSPRLVFSSEGEERRTRQPGGVLAKEIPLWKTHEKGMITITVGHDEARAKAFLTGEITDLGEKR